jgi:hypothetical protein
MDQRTLEDNMTTRKACIVALAALIFVAFVPAFHAFQKNSPFGLSASEKDSSEALYDKNVRMHGSRVSRAGS